MSTVLEQIAAPPPVALPHAERRTIVQGLRDRLIESPELAARYDRAKGVVRAFRRPAFYEVSTRCNLKCEGCYYFSDDQRAVEEELIPPSGRNSSAPKASAGSRWPISSAPSRRSSKSD